MRALILAFLLLGSPALAATVGTYGVVDANGTVENLIVSDGTGTPSCKSPPCSLVPYASLTQAELAPWQASPVITQGPPTTFAVTSTSTPALDGTYGLTQQDQMALNAIQTAILSGVTPPTTYIDSQGSHGPFTQAQLTALAVDAFQFEAAILQGQTPTQPVTIP